MTRTSLAYISASVNRQSQAAVSSGRSLVAFGSSRFVALWDLSDDTNKGVFQTLPGHEGLVTCVHFGRDDFLISGDDKGVVRYWQDIDSEWKSTRVFQAHSRAISSIYCHERILVTAASDGLVKIWEQANVKEVQIIDLRGRYALCVKLTTLPQSKAVVLAIGGTDRNIQIWTRSEEHFVRSAVLSGHEDWVRSLDFNSPASADDPVILASGSQDSTIRLWTFEIYNKNASKSSQIEPEDVLNDELLDAFETALGTLTDAEEGGRQISLKRHILTVKSGQGSSQQFSITFDALLVGHEAGVTYLSWRPTSGSISSIPTLLSTSTDSSLILWSPSTITTSLEGESTSLWINRQRFGDVGGQRLGGFVGGLWSRDGADALAWGWGGGWRRWRCTSSSGEDRTHLETWREIGAVAGPHGPVRSLAWSPNGEYVISASLDQTTRVHGAIPVSRDDGSLAYVWHELARPQVHGYDLVGVSFLDPLRFVSIADEKVARVFEAPRGFIETLRGLKVVEFAPGAENERPISASVPPLGLSNKAVKDDSQLATAVPLQDSRTFTRRPFEGELASATLWPEIDKVFGHGYESITLAVSNSKRLMATACKATSAEHAVVRVYETDTWQPVGQPLQGHSLTVTRIAFSPDDRFLLSVSRDRSWRLFENRGGSEGYVPTSADKSHSRIIWDCAWAHEGDVFATASRDKTVRIWHAGDDKSRWNTVATIKIREAATAVSFAPRANNRRVLAVGTETGEIHLYSNMAASVSDWQLESSVDKSLAHVDHIYQLAWRPAYDGAHKQLASCSEDGTLRIFEVHE